MAFVSEPRLRVLHGLRVKGVAGTDAVADAAGLPVDETEAWLGKLAAERQAIHRDTPPAGWSLTRSGRDEHRRAVADELDASGARPAVDHGYERFRSLNPAVLDVCSRWQVRDVAGHSVRNDHGDPTYDRRVLSDLADLHRRAEPVLADLTRALARFDRYGPQLATALERAQAGEGDWVAKPLIPSYHTLWFELHEDLLATLDIDRSVEAAP